MRDLEAHRAKRDPTRTPEPFGAERPPLALHPAAPRRFVVQQHAARRIHYDLRLEIDAPSLLGVPGPPPDPTNFA